MMFVGCYEDFLWVIRFPPRVHRLMVSANDIILQIEEISAVSESIAGLSLCTT